jgi:hemoglobin
MLAIHAGQGAGVDFGARFVTCFMQAVDDARLPDDLQLRDTLRSYIEWAVDEVLSYAPRDAQVRPGLRVPHWSWGGPA